MRKIFCDCCGKEINRPNNIEWKIHIDEIARNDHKVTGYVDQDFNAISGRNVGFELCNKCYNEVVIEAASKFYKLKENNNAKH